MERRISFEISSLKSSCKDNNLMTYSLYRWLQIQIEGNKFNPMFLHFKTSRSNLANQSSQTEFATLTASSSIQASIDPFIIPQWKLSSSPLPIFISLNLFKPLNPKPSHAFQTKNAFLLKPTLQTPKNSINSFSLTLTQLVFSIFKTKKESFWIQSSGYSRFHQSPGWKPLCPHTGSQPTFHQHDSPMLITKCQNGMVTEALTIASLLHLIKELQVSQLKAASISGSHIQDSNLNYHYRFQLKDFNYPKSRLDH